MTKKPFRRVNKSARSSLPRIANAGNPRHHRTFLAFYNFLFRVFASCRESIANLAAGDFSITRRFAMTFLRAYQDKPARRGNARVEARKHEERELTGPAAAVRHYRSS